MRDINEPTDKGEATNTDKEVWRGGDIFNPSSIFVTADGGIGMQHNGLVIVRALAEWHDAARRVSSAPSFADGIEAAAKRIEAEGAKYLPGGLMDMKRICHDLASDVRALANNPQASSGGGRLNDQGHSYRLSTDARDILMAHGLLAKAGGAYRLSTRDELLADPGSAGVNCNSPEAVLAVVRAVLTSSEPLLRYHTDPLRSGAAEGNEAEAAAPSLKDAILDAARHVRAQPAGLRGPYVIGDERLDGIIERLGPKSDASGAPKPDPAIVELSKPDWYSDGFQIKSIPFNDNGLEAAGLYTEATLHRIVEAALTASNDRVAELERERDEALATMTRATEAMVECGNLLADEELKREAAEAEVSRLKADIGRKEAALLAFASEENWRQGGAFDPNSPSFCGIGIASAALSNQAGTSK